MADLPGVPVRDVIADHTSMRGLKPEARAMLQAMAVAAAGAGLERIDVIAGAGGGHKSHSHGTEIDLIGYNADGSIWTAEQRVAVARGAASAGGSRFGFYSKPGRPVSSLHAGLGYGSVPRGAAWGPGGRTSGVALASFRPEERAFVADLRGGRITAAARQPAAPEQAHVRPTGVDGFPRLAELVAGGRLASKGATGDYVTELQRFLNVEGMTDQQGNSLREDGVFGKRTRAAVMAYQRARGLRVDGIVGQETMGSMLADAGPVPVEDAPLQSDIARAAGATLGARTWADWGGAFPAQDGGKGVDLLSRDWSASVDDAATRSWQEPVVPAIDAQPPAEAIGAEGPAAEAPTMPAPRTIEAESGELPTVEATPFRPAMRDPDSALDWSDPDRMMAMERARLGYIADKRAHDYHLQDRFGDAFQPGDPQGWAPRYGSFDTDAPPDDAAPVPRPKPQEAPGPQADASLNQMRAAAQRAAGAVRSAVLGSAPASDPLRPVARAAQVDTRQAAIVSDFVAGAAADIRRRLIAARPPEPADKRRFI